MVFRSQKLMEARSDFGREPCLGRSVRLSHWLPPGRSVISSNRQRQVFQLNKEVVMKLAAATAFALAFVVGAVPYAQADDDARQCSTATLRGSFGYTGTGSIVSGASLLPTAFVGTITFDGQGNATFSHVLNRNGVVIPVGPFHTTYTVNADCTGNLTAFNG